MQDDERPWDVEDHFGMIKIIKKKDDEYLIICDKCRIIRKRNTYSDSVYFMYVHMDKKHNSILKEWIGDD